MSGETLGKCEICGNTVDYPGACSVPDPDNDPFPIEIGQYIHRSPREPEVSDE